jgi:hypothetical protein
MSTFFKVLMSEDILANLNHILNVIKPFFFRPGVVVHTYNSGSWEAEAGGKSLGTV